jgi:hypothetical protein
MTEFRGEALSTLPSRVRVSESQILRVDTQHLGRNVCIRVLDGDRELFSDFGPEVTSSRAKIWLHRHFPAWTALDS